MGHMAAPSNTPNTEFSELTPDYWATDDFSQTIRRDGTRYVLFDNDGERANVGSLARAMEIASWPVTEDAEAAVR